LKVKRTIEESFFFFLQRILEFPEGRRLYQERQRQLIVSQHYS